MNKWGNMKRKVFVFWIGEKNEIKELLSKLRSLDFEVHLGPSKEEHDFLYEEYKYYKMSYDQKIWAFCSDVWRLYVLSKQKGMYIDSSVIIGKDLSTFYDFFINNETTLFKESAGLIANAVMLSGVENNVFFADILSKYKINHPENLDVRLLPIGPMVVTSHAMRHFGFKPSFTDQSLKNEKGHCINIFSLLQIRNKNSIFKAGFGSWWQSAEKISNKKLAKNHWQNLESKWRRQVGKNDHQRLLKVLSKREDLPVWVREIRRMYDSSKSEAELKELKLMYKRIDYKIKFSELLIWSKMYRTFSLKKVGKNSE